MISIRLVKQLSHKTTKNLPLELPCAGHLGQIDTFHDLGCWTWQLRRFCPIPSLTTQPSVPAKSVASGSTLLVFFMRWMLDTKGSEQAEGKDL